VKARGAEPTLWDTPEADPIDRLRALPGLPPCPATEPSLEAKRLLRRLRAGAVSLADVLDLTVDPGALRAWADELRQAGYLVDEDGPGAAGTASYSLRAGGD